MYNGLATYSFPDAYYTVVTGASAVKYVSASGSDSNNGNAATTPYLTIAQALSATSATATSVAIVILAGTYVITPQANGSSYATSAITDSNKPRIFVGCPGQVKIQFTNASGYGPYAVDFQNSGSACYGITFERNNAGKTNSYEVAVFCGSSTVGNLKGNFYNCAFTETNANGLWSLQYDNESRIASQVNNCTFKFGATGLSDYSGGTGLNINYCVFNQANSGGSATKSNTLYSQTVNATTYAVTGVSTAGVYSGTYAWNGTTTFPPGLYTNSSNIKFGSSVIFTLYSANTGNIPYTISGVTSNLISNASLTGNFVMSGGTANVTVTSTNLATSNTYTIMMSADSTSANVTLSPNVTILTTVIGIGSPENTMYLEGPIPGQMNVYDSVVTVAQYDKGGSTVSAYPVSGQMNISDSIVTVTDATKGTQISTPLISNMVNSTIVPYTTITNKISGPIDQGIIKLFGDNPTREFWM